MPVVICVLQSTRRNVLVNKPERRVGEKEYSALSVLVGLKLETSLAGDVRVSLLLIVVK